jgi:hypothetical protein
MHEQAMATRGPDPTVTDTELLSVVQSVDTPVVTANCVSDRVDLGSERCRQRLNRLSDQGKVQSEKLNQIRVYWVED